MIDCNGKQENGVANAVNVGDLLAARERDFGNVVVTRQLGKVYPITESAPGQAIGAGLPALWARKRRKTVLSPAV